MEKAGDILKDFFDSQNDTGVFRSWQKIAGVSLSQHTRIIEVRNGDVLIEVDHPGWLQMLLFKKAAILNTLKRTYPDLEIRDLKPWVRQAGRTEKKDLQKGVKTGKIISAKRSEIEAELTQVKDERLKESLRKLYLSSLKKHRSD